MLPLGSETDDATANLSRNMKEAAIQTAVAQTSVSVAASLATNGVILASVGWVPIVGWAIAAVMAIGTWIGGDIAKRKVKGLLEGAKADLKAMGERAGAEVKAAQTRVADEEWGAAERLAVSDAPLDGLGSFFSKRNLTRAASTVVTRAHWAAGKPFFKTGAAGARLVGDKRGAERVKKREEAWDRNQKRVEKMFAEKLQNPFKSLARDLDTIGRTISGQQVVHVVRRKLGELKAAAQRQLDAYKTAAIEQANTDEYRQQVRTDLAKAMRKDPGFEQMAADIRARNARIDAEFAPSALKASVPQGPEAGGGGLLAAAGLIGAWFFLRP